MKNRFFEGASDKSWIEATKQLINAALTSSQSIKKISIKEDITKAGSGKYYLRGNIY